MKAYGRNEDIGFHNINGSDEWPDKADAQCLGLPVANMSKTKTRRTQRKLARRLAKDHINKVLVGKTE
jgi:hypothetical protein